MFFLPSFVSAQIHQVNVKIMQIADNKSMSILVIILIVYTIIILLLLYKLRKSFLKVVLSGTLKKLYFNG